MRKWRVGSVSMGILLVFLGVMLLLSQFNNWDVVTVAMMWLPAVLIVLGLEIIIYYFLSKQESPVVKYDVFSIVLICLIGVFSIGAYVVSSTGVLTVFDNVVHAEEVEGALPEIEHQIDDAVEQIVIESSGNQVSLEGNQSNNLSLFGTFRSNVLNVKDIKKEQMASIHQSGDTLYVQLHRAPSQQGLGYGYSHFNTTISAPTDVDVEVRSRVESVHVAFNELKADWYIESAHEAVVKHQEGANVTFEANVDRVEGLEQNEPVDEAQGSKRSETSTRVDRMYGEGAHYFSVQQLDHLTVRR